MQVSSHTGQHMSDFQYSPPVQPTVQIVDYPRQHLHNQNGSQRAYNCAFHPTRVDTKNYMDGKEGIEA